MSFKPVVLASALAVSLGAVALAQPTWDLDQGWGAPERQDWYHLSQGSRLIPLAWLKALEQPAGGGHLFLEDAYIAGFRYLPAPVGAAGDRLPVGFAADATPPANLTRTNLQWKAGQSSGEKWVGMNCAACHTAEITYSARGTRPVTTMRIEGGPTLADFQGFINQLNLALALTLNPPAADKGRFDRFALGVLGPENSQANRARLKTALAALIARQQAAVKANAVPAGYHYGFGRLDAFGNIYTKVAIAAAANPTSNQATAPVSYPFLWNVPQHDKVQWNGIAPNRPTQLPPLLRNTGEVIGVFADIEFKPPGLIPLPAAYRSSVNVANLYQLESKLVSLKPPKWPDEVFGDTATPEQFQRGADLYRDHCASCHALLPRGRDDLQTPIKAEMFTFASTDPARPPPGTDLMMACNAVTRTADAGALRGTLYAALPPKNLKKQANVSDMLIVAAVGALLGQGEDVGDVIKADLLRASNRTFGTAFTPVPPGAWLATTPQPTAAELERRRLEFCRTTLDDKLAYKARPLYGVWATAPFLHNGSVPTLYDLLLPAGARPKHFLQGTREYDPVMVGFVTLPRPDNTSRFDVVDNAENAIVGNSNAGHDYNNAQFTPEDRWAIIAYLKKLPPRPVP